MNLGNIFVIVIERGLLVVFFHHIFTKTTLSQPLLRSYHNSINCELYVTERITITYGVIRKVIIDSKLGSMYVIPLSKNSDKL